MNRVLSKPLTQKILAILLMASFAFLTFVMIWRQQADMRQRVSERDLTDRQASLEWRLARLEAAASVERRTVAAQLNDLNERQSASDRHPVGNAPFETAPLAAAVVEVVCLDSVRSGAYFTASGTVIDGSGLIITNRHLLESGDNKVSRYCGIGFTTDTKVAPTIDYIATTVAVHANNDLALLQITERLDGGTSPSQYPFLSLSEAAISAQGLQLGDGIWIAGYPGIGAETITFTSGVVSGRVGEGLIKTSALIDSGTSGGAAFDSQGHYVGIPTAAVAGDIGGSLGFLISADAVTEFLEKYLARQPGPSVP